MRYMICGIAGLTKMSRFRYQMYIIIVHVEKYVNSLTPIDSPNYNEVNSHKSSPKNLTSTRRLGKWRLIRPRRVSN